MILKKHKEWFIPVLLAGVVKILSLNSSWVESSYSNSIYLFIASILRFLFGWLPFSIGDIFYSIIILWLLYITVKGVVNLIKRRTTWKGTGKNLLKISKVLLWIYIVFNFLWGLNYNRKGIAFQLELPKVEKNSNDLIIVDSILVTKVNICKQSLVMHQQQYPSADELFSKSIAAYHNVENQFSFLHYPFKSVKKSVFGSLGNYFGYTGYYNPFTAEAQVNTSVPAFFLPFTTCHEIAHQLGYAKENEANFVGYLVATNSSDTLFQYSAYLDMLIYTNRTLARYDSTAAKSMITKLSADVKKDLKYATEYFAKYKSPIEPIIKWGYGLFLKTNEQPQGILSYDEVTALLIAYYKKYGAL